jgi:type IV pilus assembly protein PilB
MPDNLGMQEHLSAHEIGNLHTERMPSAPDSTTGTPFHPAPTQQPTVEELWQINRFALFEECMLVPLTEDGVFKVFLPNNSDHNPFETRRALEKKILENPYNQQYFETLLQQTDKSVTKDTLSYFRGQLNNALQSHGAFPIMYETQSKTLWVGINMTEADLQTLRKPDHIVYTSERLKSLALLRHVEDVKLLLLTPTETHELLEAVKRRDKLQQKLRVIEPTVQATQVFGTIVDVALDWKASDIHLKPRGNKQYLVSYRVDGKLVPVYELTEDQGKALISIIKNRAELNIAENRRRQDGAINFNEKGKLDGVNLRVATILTQIGEGEAREAIVMRVLNSRSEAIIPLEKMGYEQDQVALIRDVMQAPQGIIIVTGPTGSGKTTLLYAALREMITPSLNIITIEDPVEQLVPGLVQVRVDETIDNTFQNVFRGVLRLDPDVILVGEIRDKIVSETAVSAANTGHLVLTTLHANSSIEALPRLLDLGINGTQFQSIKAIIAQRLIRNICLECSETYDARDALNKLFEEELLKQPIHLVRPKNDGEGLPSCSCCHGSGYKGRQAVGEVLRLNPEQHDMLRQGDFRFEELYRSAARTGFRPMLFTAMTSLLKHKTSLKEVLEVVDAEDFRRRKNSLSQYISDWVEAYGNRG